MGTWPPRGIRKLDYASLLALLLLAVPLLAPRGASTAADGRRLQMLGGSDGTEPLAAGGGDCSAIGSLLAESVQACSCRACQKPRKNILPCEFFTSSCCNYTPQPKGEPPICQRKSDGP